jgi:hypothetical protein
VLSGRARIYFGENYQDYVERHEEEIALGQRLSCRTSKPT